MMFLYILSAAAAFLALRAYYRAVWARGLAAEMRFTVGQAYAGDEVELSEVIENRKRLPLPELEVGFRVPKGLEFIGTENVVVSDYVYKRDIFSLRGMESVTRKLRIRCVKRGRYPVSQLTLRVLSMFHTREYMVSLDTEEELYVYAGGIDVSSVLFLAESLTGEAESRVRRYEDPFCFSGIREYEVTDPMRAVNWKATARTGKLMVNTYSSVLAEKYMLFLDVTDDRIVKEQALVEASVSAAASLARRLIRQGSEVGIAVNASPPEVIPPKGGAEQLTRIERCLTADFTNAASEYLSLMDREIPSSRNADLICIYITKEKDPERLKILKKMSGRYGKSLLVIPERAGGRIRLRGECGNL